MCTWPPNIFIVTHLIIRITKIIIIRSDLIFWEVKCIYKPHKNVSYVDGFSSSFMSFNVK